MGLDKYAVGSLWMTREGGKAIILYRSFETDQVRVFHYGAGAAFTHNADGVTDESAYNLNAPWAEAIKAEHDAWMKDSPARCSEMCAIMSEGRKVLHHAAETFDGDTYRASYQEYGRRIEIKRGSVLAPILQEECMRFAKEMNNAGVDTIIWRTAPKYEVLVDEATGARILRMFWCLTCMNGHKQIIVAQAANRKAA